MIRMMKTARRKNKRTRAGKVKQTRSARRRQKPIRR